MSDTIRPRGEIPAKYKWNAVSVYPTEEAWEAEADSLLVRLEEIKQMEGSVGQSARSVADALDSSYTLLETFGKVITYSFNAQAVDNADANAARMFGKTQSILGRSWRASASSSPRSWPSTRRHWRNGERTSRA